MKYRINRRTGDRISEIGAAPFSADAFSASFGKKRLPFRSKWNMIETSLLEGRNVPGSTPGTFVS